MTPGDNNLLVGKFVDQDGGIKSPTPAIQNYRINDDLSQKVIDLPDSDMDSSDEEEEGEEGIEEGSSSSGEELDEDDDIVDEEERQQRLDDK